MSGGGKLTQRKDRHMAIDINEINGMFVVEWNLRQKQFRIQALGEILKSNLIAAVNGRSTGYVPVAIAQTEKEVLEMSKLIEAKLKKPHYVRDLDSTDTLP